jgi:hypothetical protein
MNTKEIAVLVEVRAKISDEYKKNQNSDYFDAEYAEGLSVAGLIVSQKIQQLQQEQKENAARTEDLQRAG